MRFVAIKNNEMSHRGAEDTFFLLQECEMVHPTAEIITIHPVPKQGFAYPEAGTPMSTHFFEEYIITKPSSLIVNCCHHLEHSTEGNTRRQKMG